MNIEILNNWIFFRFETDSCTGLYNRHFYPHNTNLNLHGIKTRRRISKKCIKYESYFDPASVLIDYTRSNYTTSEAALKAKTSLCFSLDVGVISCNIPFQNIWNIYVTCVWTKSFECKLLYDQTNTPLKLLSSYLFRESKRNTITNMCGTSISVKA